MAMHTWGGGGHASTCLLKIHPDGGVEAFLGSQDLGTGTRTAIAVVTGRNVWAAGRSRESEHRQLEVSG